MNEPANGHGSEPVTLSLGGTTVAWYDDGGALEPSLAPRPHLHPVRTLAGTPVTDACPADHRWHLGVSVAVQDVDRTNFWGGRTYVRDHGYQRLDDHGRVIRGAWLEHAADHLESASTGSAGTARCCSPSTARCVPPRCRCPEPGGSIYIHPAERRRPPDRARQPGHQRP